MSIETKNKKQKTKPIKYYFNDNRRDNMVHYCWHCENGYNDGECEKCHGTGIYSIYQNKKNYILEDYDYEDVKVRYCNNCQGTDCPKCRGYGFTSIKLQEALTILVNEKYQTKRIEEAPICSKCLRSLNTNNCNLCSGHGTVLKCLQKCCKCSGYGFVLKKKDKKSKYQKCKKCSGKGVSHTACLEINPEQCKNVISRIIKFRQFLTDNKLKYKSEFQGKIYELLFADQIKINESPLNENSDELLFQSLKISFKSIRELVEQILKKVIQTEKMYNRLQIMQLYTAQVISNWPHHSLDDKEKAGTVLHEKDLLSVFDLLEETINKFLSLEINDLTVVKNKETDLNEQKNILKMDSTNINKKIIKSLENKRVDNKNENNLFKNYFLHSEKY
ncbi:putative transmembrane protein [Anaeramoeba flamelloides]|uniref:Transmembrane protein n=1 Tax=Anaeramoeba flamelloides TaxID=1746091 RepID=A0AAV7ZST3_9EUKA|nr:putative transmembrane protein [Anaeramoeba flamelloides]